MSIGLACLAGFMFAVNIVGTRLVLDRTGARTDAVAVVTVAGAAVVAALIALVGGVRIDDLTWESSRGFVLVGAIVPGLAQLTFYAAIGLAGPSRTGVMVGTVPMWSVVLAIVFLDESWSLPITVGTLLTVTGAVLLARPEVRIQVSRLGLFLGAVTALQFGVRDVVARSLTRDSDLEGAAAAVVILLVGALVLMVATLIAAGREGLAAGARASLPLALLPAAAIGIAMPALLEAFERARVGVVSPLNNASQSVAAVVLSGAVFGRTEVDRRVVVAVVSVVAGGTLIGVFR